MWRAIPGIRGNKPFSALILEPPMFKFLHAADLHMDSPLKGLSELDPTLAEQVRLASRMAFEKMIKLAKDEKVAFVLLAGDILDGEIKDHGTIQFLLSRLGDLAQTIPVYVIRGNHDFVNNLGAALAWPKNVIQFGSDKPTTQLLHDYRVAIHGQSFASRAVDENLAANYPAAKPDFFNIGMLHTSLSGAEGHDTYAPVSPQELQQKNYDYWALGHIHKRAMVREGNPWIVFPGNIQGRSIRETGPRGCALVTVEDSHLAKAQFVDLDAVRFHEVEVDLTGMELIEELPERIRPAGEQLVSPGVTVIRVRLVGETRLAGEITANSQLNHEVRQMLSGLGKGIVLEKLKVECVLPTHSASISEDDGALLGEVVKDWVSNPNALDTLLEGDKEYQDLRKKLAKVLPQNEVDALLDPGDILPGLEHHLKTKTEQL